jgi:hypothetical protein
MTDPHHTAGPCARHFDHLQFGAGGGSEVALTSFERGKLKIAAHVREELELARIPFQSIQCRSGSLHIPPGVLRLIVTVDETPRHLDLAAADAEDCELLVAGETWHKIAAFIEGLRKGPEADSE